MKLSSRFWVWSLITLLLGFLVLPEVGHSLWHYQHHRRIELEKEQITKLIQAGEHGYESLVRLVPSLSFPNVPAALQGILAQTNHDRVADLCAIYVACGQKSNHKEAIARVLAQLGDPRAAATLIKELELVGTSLSLISHDAEIETLGSIKAKEAGDVLLKIIQSHFSWEGSAWKVKEEAFVALGRIGDERAIPDAAHHLGDGADWYINKGAMNYLTRIGNSEAREVLNNAFHHNPEPELPLCLVQVGEASILPEIRNGLTKWLDNYAIGSWEHTDYWGIFYYVHALIIAQDTNAVPELCRALKVLKSNDQKTNEYVRDDANGYSRKLLLDERKAETLVSDLQAFLKANPPEANPNN